MPKYARRIPPSWEQWLKIVETVIAKNPHRTVFNVAANDGTGSGICCCDKCKAWDHPDAVKDDLELSRRKRIGRQSPRRTAR